MYIRHEDDSEQLICEQCGAQTLGWAYDVLPKDWLLLGTDHQARELYVRDTQYGRCRTNVAIKLPYPLAFCCQKHLQDWLETAVENHVLVCQQERGVN